MLEDFKENFRRKKKGKFLHVVSPLHAASNGVTPIIILQLLTKLWASKVFGLKIFHAYWRSLRGPKHDGGTEKFEIDLYQGVYSSTETHFRRKTHLEQQRSQPIARPRLFGQLL